MCLLTFTLPGEYPDLERLSDASLANSDGFGWAIADIDKGGPNGRIIRGHSLSIDQALTEYADNLKTTYGPSLFHLRFATHGWKDLSNCHPFPSDRGRTAIAHNGIINQVTPKGGESDTAAFVRRYWPSWANSQLDTPEAFRHLEQWVGSGNKLVILTTDPRYKANSYIVNESQGHWDNGTWFSNYSYTWCDYEYSAPYTPKTYGKAYIRINGVLKDLETGLPVFGTTPVPADDCKGYAHGCECGACVTRDETTDRDETACMEFYPLKCLMCQTEFLVSADDEQPYCPTCDVCWYCDSDRSCCLCNGER